MEASFGPERFFMSNNDWFVYMRPGDEVCEMHVGLRLVDFQKVGESIIAGPFKRKDSVVTWLTTFISLHGKNREENDEGISDGMVLPSLH